MSNVPPAPPSHPNGRLYLAIYDVTADNERRRVARVLEGRGLRVQKSAFELRLSAGGRQRVENDLARLDLSTGHVFIYRLDETAKRSTIGQAPVAEISDRAATFIV